MIKAPIELRDLRQRIYVKAKAAETLGGTAAAMGCSAPDANGHITLDAKPSVVREIRMRLTRRGLET